MPVGIPKVAFLIPDDKDSSWVDLYHRITRDRVICLCQEVEEVICNQIAGLMVYLGLENPTQDLNMFVNSMGGSVIAGVSLYDTMQFVKPEIQTICLGKAYSLGALILLGGAPSKRLGFPNCKVMLHHPSKSPYIYDDSDDDSDDDDSWKTQDSNIDSFEMEKWVTNMKIVFAERTGKTFCQIENDMKRTDLRMSVEEAQAHGIIDRVVERGFLSTIFPRRDEDQTRKDKNESIPQTDTSFEI